MTVSVLRRDERENWETGHCSTDSQRDISRQLIELSIRGETGGISGSVNATAARTVGRHIELSIPATSNAAYRGVNRTAPAYRYADRDSAETRPLHQAR